jgi:hypothetical protein
VAATTRSAGAGGSRARKRSGARRAWVVIGILIALAAIAIIAGVVA